MISRDIKLYTLNYLPKDEGYFLLADINRFDTSIKEYIQSNYFVYDEAVYIERIGKSEKRKEQLYISRFMIKLIIKYQILKSSVRLRDICIKGGGSAISAYVDNNELQYNISISHKENYIVVALSRHRIGVDIERLIKNPIIADEVFSNGTERRLFNNFDKTAAATFIWNLKEAVLKAVGIGFSKGLHYVTLNKVKDTVTVNVFEGEDSEFYKIDSIRSYVHIIKDFFINIVLLEE